MYVENSQPRVVRTFDRDRHGSAFIFLADVVRTVWAKHVAVFS
jgi:hypothetical protein